MDFLRVISPETETAEEYSPMNRKFDVNPVAMIEMMPNGGYEASVAVVCPDKKNKTVPERCHKHIVSHNTFLVNASRGNVEGNSKHQSTDGFTKSKDQCKQESKKYWIRTDNERQDRHRRRNELT